MCDEGIFLLISDDLLVDLLVHSRAPCVSVHIPVYGDTFSEGYCSSSMKMLNNFSKVIFWNIKFMYILYMFIMFTINYKLQFHILFVL